ncbi:stage II sporulation protein E, partial [Selenomonadales bacterium OttesenSCG-928-I06]|nr:stage II sporulation protein E [Selenomonadales bacterium OttesenSCG-928-I06]
NLFGYMVVVINAAFCLILSFIFKYGMPLTLNIAKPIDQMKTEYILGSIFIITAATAGLSSLYIFGYSIQNVIGSLLIMSFALIGGPGIGSATGVLLGLVLSLNTQNFQFSIAMYSMSGLLGGIFRELGKPAVILGFLFGNMIALLYFMNASTIEPYLIETSVAAILFLIIPTEKYQLLKQQLLPDINLNSFKDESILKATAKLSFVSGLLNSLSQDINTSNNEKILADNNKIKDTQLNEVLAIVGNNVCDPCANRKNCWDTEFYHIYQSILEMLTLAENNNLSEKTIPPILKSRCDQKEELVKLINQIVENNQVHWYWQRKLSDCHQVTVEQLKATSAIIDNLALEINKEPRDDKETALRIKKQATALSCPVADAKVVGNAATVGVKIKKEACAGTKECANTLLPLTSNILKEKMILKSSCGDRCKNQLCELSMTMAQKYQTETAIASAPKEVDPYNTETTENIPCGDSHAYLSLEQGKEIMLLSDGMGSGKSAQEQSSTAIEFFKKLLLAGFNVETTIKTVNSMLLLKKPTETFATVDAAIVDTYTAEAEFLKIGAAPTFIKRVGEVDIITSNALPAGIVEQLEFESIKRTLCPEDIIIMVSDGILENKRSKNGEVWLTNFLRRLNTAKPQEIADNILKQAKELSDGHVNDDMTVIVTKVKNKE